MLKNKNFSAAFISPQNLGAEVSSASQDSKKFEEEKKVIKEAFAAFGNRLDIGSPAVREKLSAIAKEVITTTAEFVDMPDMIPEMFEVRPVEPGDEGVWIDYSGANVYYGTYGAAVRMSRPTGTKYKVSTTPKEVGLALDIVSISTGKYSPSQLGQQVGKLIVAWRNKLAFDTLRALTAFQSGGAQYQTGATLSNSDMIKAADKITDEGELKFIVGRRKSIHTLSTLSGYSDATKREFETLGQVGAWGGVPIIRLNGYTDQTYGTVFPMTATELFMFSQLPVGLAGIASQVRTSDDVNTKSETLDVYFRWDDGIAITKIARAATVAAITPA